MKFTVYGPFELPRKNRILDRDNAVLKALWKDLETRHPSLPDACGCYMFCLRAPRGIIPWYVGKTEKRDFRNECLGPHQRDIYNEVLAGSDRATPVLILIAKMTPTGRFAQPTRNQHPDIDGLETLLIGAALEKNPNLSNAKKTRWLREMEVPGFINTPRRAPTLEEREFRAALG